MTRPIRWSIKRSLLLQNIGIEDRVANRGFWRLTNVKQGCLAAARPTQGKILSRSRS